MNLDYLIQKLMRRATCQLGRGASLGRTARIRNIANDDSCIRVGQNSIIQGELLVFAHGGRITLGDWCYVGEHTRIWSARSITIGDRVLISHGVNMFDSLTHPLDAKARHQQFRKIAKHGHPREIDLDERPVEICDDAWIGAGAFVMRGVTIGEGAIVAAASVVTDNVAPRCIVAGNPARVLRELDADER
jgi:acetyltransferase-like isoleucine patch superfamily enzyme